MAIFEDYLTNTLRAADELYNAPSLAVPLASSMQAGDDPTQQAQAIAHASNMQAHAKATDQLKKHYGGGLFSRAFKFLGAAASSVVHFEEQNNPFVKPTEHVTPEQVQQEAQAKGLDPNEYLKQETAAGRINTSSFATQVVNTTVANSPQALSAPLAEVQHQYRYLRDVQSRHGTAAALSELGLVAAGTAAGAAVGSLGGATQQGAVLGGELVGGVAGRLRYQDSWDRTVAGEAYRDPRTGEKVSPGRDVARGVGGLPIVGSLPYGLVSGIADGIFDLTADPVQNALHIVHSPTGPVMTADDLDRLLVKNPQRTFAVASDLASKTADEIRATPAYAKFAPIANSLGDAETPEEVIDRLKSVLLGPEVRGITQTAVPSGILPTPETQGQIGPWESLLRKARTKLNTNAIDPDTLEHTQRRIDPTSNAPDHVQALRNSFLMGRTPTPVVNRLMADYQIAPTVAERVTIAREGFYRAGLSVLPTDIAADPETQSRLRQMIKEHTGGATAGVDDQYGFAADGRSTSRVATARGDTSAGIWLNQTGDITAPDYAALQRWGRDAKTALSTYGKIDDAVYANLTVPFKRMALLTGGFGLRVGMGEAIPATFRNGLLDTVKAAIAAKRPSFPDITDAEVPDLADAVLHSLNASDPAAAEKALGDLNLRELAAEVQMAQNGHMVPPSLQMGNYVSNDIAGKTEALSHDIFKVTQETPGVRELDLYKGYEAGDPDQPLYWQRAIREAANDKGAQQIAATYRDAIRRGVSQDGATRLAVETDRQFLSELGPLEQSAFIRSQSLADDPLTEWAQTRVETFKGLTHSPDWAGKSGMDTAPGPSPHVSIIDAIAKGEAPDIATLKSIDTADRPLLVKGRISVPDTSGSVMARIANKGFGNVLGPIVNTLGREHQYLLAVQKNLTPQLLDLVDSGLLSRDEALLEARYKATLETLRFVHNPEERTQLSVPLRNFIPFYFAQEQSYRRLGRLAAEDPAAARKYMLAIMGMRDYTQQVKDETGTEHILMPGLGLMNEATLGLMKNLGAPVLGAVPTAVTGNVTSLNTVFPFAEGVRPSLSPLLTIPAHMLMSLDPSMRPLVEKAVGGPAANSQVWEQLLPNTPLRNLFKAIGPGQDQSTAFQSSMISTLQFLQARQDSAMAKWVAAGKSPDDPNAPAIVPPDLVTTDGKPNNSMAAQKFWDRLRNQTRINFVFKSVLSAVTPVAPGLSIGDVKLQDELQTMMQKSGASQGLQDFLAKYPDATAYTVFKSDSPTGVLIPSNKPASDWVAEHGELLADYRHAAPYLVPQDATGKYDAAVYNEQIAQGLRTRRNAQDFAKAFYVAAGNSVFYDQALPAHQAALAQAQGDPVATTTENNAFSAWLNTVFGPGNPVWWDDFKSADREHERQAAMSELIDLYSSGKAPNDPQAKDVGLLLQDWQTHQLALQQGKLDGWSADERKTENEAFLSYLDQLKTTKPQLGMVINRLFRPTFSTVFVEAQQ